MSPQSKIIVQAGDFARWVKIQRAELGINKTTLAKQSGLNRTTIVEMEKQERDPTVTNAVKIIQGLGKTFQDFEQFLEGGNHVTNI